MPTRKEKRPKRAEFAEIQLAGDDLENFELQGGCFLRRLAFLFL
jgi:hypothetical protein